MSVWTCTACGKQSDGVGARCAYCDAERVVAPSSTSALVREHWWRYVLAVPLILYGVLLFLGGALLGVPLLFILAPIVFCVVGAGVIRSRSRKSTILLVALSFILWLLALLSLTLLSKVCFVCR